MFNPPTPGLTPIVPVPTVPVPRAPGQIPTGPRVPVTIPTMPTGPRVPVPIPIVATPRVPLPTMTTPRVPVTIPTVPRTPVPTMTTPRVPVTIPTMPTVPRTPVPTVPMPGQLIPPDLPFLPPIPVMPTPVQGEEIVRGPPLNPWDPQVLFNLPSPVLVPLVPPQDVPNIEYHPLHHQHQVANRDLPETLYPLHGVTPIQSNFIQILGRRNFTRRPRMNDEEMIITPHKIILSLNAPIFRATPVGNVVGLTFRYTTPEDEREPIIKLRGPWIIQPLHANPDGTAGGFLAKLPYQLFPRIRIGTDWMINHVVPVPVNYLQPIEMTANGYIYQENPMPQEFQFQTTDYNSAFFQASIETSRKHHPNLETMIQAAEAIDVLPELRNRNQFGSYLQDATFFEINRIYRGQRVAAARKFLLFMQQSRMPRELIEDNYRYDLIPFTDAQRAGLDAFLRNRGYHYTYMGYLKSDEIASQIRINDANPTPQNFLPSITPDHAILMEAWRKRILTTYLSTDNLVTVKNLLGFRSIVDRTDFSTVPMVTNLGFSRIALLNVIERLDTRVNDIRYPGEDASDVGGVDRSQRHVIHSISTGKPYLMMLYAEAVRRNRAR